MLDISGPSTALRNTTIAYAAVLILCGVYMHSGDGQLEAQGLFHQIGRALLFGLFVLENCFVQLLFTQHWAFMSSVQTREEAAVWFGPIAGIGSIISTAVAFTVAPLIDVLGLAALLIVAGIFMLVSAYFAMDAYRIAKQVCTCVDRWKTTMSNIYASLFWISTEPYSINIFLYTIYWMR